jgi:hypothetical protein
MNMRSEAVIRIPMAGTQPVLSIEPEPHKLLRKRHEEEAEFTEGLGTHAADAILSGLMGIPHGLTEAFVEGIKAGGEINDVTTRGLVSNRVAHLGSMVMKPEDALEAGGGSAGKIIDRNAEKRAAESESDVQQRKQKPKP